MAFDCTYVSSGLAQLELHDRRGMAGGIWLPDNTENTFLELDEKLDISTCRKATTMIDFLLWDAGATKKCPISACAVPVEHNFAIRCFESCGFLFAHDLMWWKSYGLLG